ncbi:hypothetical protein BZA05DRAFT_132545 [Tricharina praecox]|uniref:uncharacterized protein n=1 Tax=Tricharina praecox TaxID=43433 RepID=UPI00221FBE73|nr:uncharacterized protein BZA05DRAFT_132545 [Tricharina praecox]KAI5846652.1 hypothetical protein BZA05DRAFT_132545 [Tricharina praecox]
MKTPLLLRILCVLATFASPSAALSAANSNSTDLVSCVYPVSGSYGLLPRCLFYVTLVFAVVGAHRWLVVGCLLSSMTTSSVGAFHAMVLGHDGNNPSVIDLDARVLLVLLSTCVLCFCPLIQWAPALRNPAGRRIFEIWGLLIWAGEMCCIVVYLLQILAGDSADQKSSEVACRGADGQLLRTPLDIAVSGSDCSYECFSRGSVLRGSLEVLVVPIAMLDGALQKKALIFTTALTLLAMVGMPVYAVHARNALVINFQKIRILSSLGEDIKDISETRLNHLKMDKSKIFNRICFAALIAVIILNEYIFATMSGGLPSFDPMFSIGQWEPWVKAGVLMGAALVNGIMEESGDTRRRRTRRSGNAEKSLA